LVTFGDRVIERMRRLGHPLCVGLDPYFDRIPQAFRQGSMLPGDPATVKAVEEFCCRTVDLVAGQVAIVKPQSSLFERLGWRGSQALEKVVTYASDRDLLVLLDAKRGDIADTALAYAQAYLAHDAVCAVDALTVNPYLGPSTLDPFFREAEKNGRGVIVLLRNSNLDSSAFQKAQTNAGPFYQVIAESLAAWDRRLNCGTTGWSSCGVTVAATHAADSEHIRALLPSTLFLVLGYGAQGASARDAVRGFRRGPSGLEGGIVNSSRPILFPTAPDAPLIEWERGVRSMLAATAYDLGEAVA
jgi:orotidine-5'-phosphate decarboxylase